MTDFASILSENAVIGGASITTMVVIYKIYQILKHDKKEDNISQIEKSIRDELRSEIKELKTTIKDMKKVNEKNLYEIARLRNTVDANSKTNFKNQIEARRV